MRLPSVEDINVYDSLDERHAVEVFLGKDLQQAQALFRENFLYHQEDLLFMGPRAFHFYLTAAINYLLSEAANGDTDAASTFCGLIEFRLDHEPEVMVPVASVLREGIGGILKDFDRFGFGVNGLSGIYGDIPERYRLLLSRLDDCVKLANTASNPMGRKSVSGEVYITRNN